MLALAGYQNRGKLMEMLSTATGGSSKTGSGEPQTQGGPGPNKEIAPPQLKQAIGRDVLATLVKQTALPQEEPLARLSRELPSAVDKYKPDGRLPAQA